MTTNVKRSKCLVTFSRNLKSVQLPFSYCSTKIGLLCPPKLLDISLHSWPNLQFRIDVVKEPKYLIFCKTLLFAIFNSNFYSSPAAPDRHCQGTTRNLCTSDLSGVDGDPPQSHNHALPCQTFVLSSSFCSSSSTKDSEAGLSEHLQHQLHHLE